MSVHLDWQIESERAQQRAGEDPSVRMRRRRQRLAIALFTIALAALVIGVAGAVLVRLATVDNSLRQSLENAAHAEVTALKLGDLPEFMALMRGGNSTWLPEQSARFAGYQDLKQKGAIRFTDNVLDATVDGQRGRAVVEEIINGQPYHAVWFFWRYLDGWRHVPSDLTFWGDPGTIAGKSTSVSYFGLDSAYAQAVADRVERWWSEGCIYLGCAQLPMLTVQIVPDPSVYPLARWDDQNPAQLLLGSPLASGERAPVDPVVPAAVEAGLADRLAERLFDLASGQLITDPNSDAAWIRQSTIDWLSAAMLGHGDPARIAFIQSLKDSYGPQGMISMIHALSPGADIGVLSKALGQPLEALVLDWRSFFQWRLALEKVLVTGGNQTAFFNLWDPTPEALARARQRLSHPEEALLEVRQVAVGRDSTNMPVATVQAQSGSQTYILQFRLVGGNWRRFV